VAGVLRGVLYTARGLCRFAEAAGSSTSGGPTCSLHRRWCAAQCDTRAAAGCC